ncbi:hypothetical protein ACIOC2_14405 [Streptomyces sp. NPDC088337]|uniref:hypothetical protein n=1 Tax=unclassified Streptomyces TaxID=2593676 RepID=UPI002DD9E0FE|nr:hypothetical protein [Streptomyces sp. NBC_01788]WSB25521.1 hypothetical protein OIE49_06320 [Streptomyces sp. NBC_01788]
MTGVSACSAEEEFPVPTDDQVVGTWSNPGRDWIKFKEGGTGLISAGAQLQLSALMEEADIKDACEFSWGVDTVPAGGSKWVSVTFTKGQCGFSGPGEFGLNYYYTDSGELRLSPAVEFPEPDEVYARTNAAS